jgi:phosphoglycolate phosphatase
MNSSAPETVVPLGANTGSSYNLEAQNVLRRRWDAYDAYLFDVDGTLLHCRDAIHYHAFRFALQMLCGHALELAGVTTHGNTDVGILRDALNAAGVSEETWRPRIAEAQAAMCGYASDRCDEMAPAVMPGTQQVLRHLREQGALLGVATGNLEIIGRLKLEKAKLLDYFTLFAFSDMFEFREQVFRHALTCVRAKLGAGAQACVVGDTPADVCAAHASRMDVIAVATGVHSLEELVGAGPNLCVSSLLELLAPGPLVAPGNSRQSAQTE